MPNIEVFIQRAILLLPPFFLAISLHESAHAYVAYRFGDPTAKNLGRITLNPLHHIDIMGLIVLLIARFGWAKPVPVNPNNLKNPRKDNIWISLAGPASNFILAIISALFFHLLAAILPPTTIGVYTLEMVRLSVILNIILMVFNMLPLPPLDGYHILEGIVPHETYLKLQQYKHIGPTILLGLILMGWVFKFSVFSIIFSPFIRILGGLLLGSSNL